MRTTKHAPFRLLTVGLAAALLPTWADGAGLQGKAPIKTYDDELAEMVDEMPGFGGWYLAEDGRMHVYMADLSAEAARSLEREDMVLEQSSYDFRQLLSWKRDLRAEVLSLPGVLSLDIDESRNVLVIGVEHAAHRMQVEALASRLNLPWGAFEVEQVEPMEFAATLRTFEQYRRGGLQIQYLDNGTWNCSIGFIAYHQGTINPPPGYSNRGMVTASHCSTTQGTVDDTIYHHPTTGYSGFAHELLDPPLFTGGACPAGRSCRFSDAIFAAYHPLSSSSSASIARPRSRGRTSGTLELLPSNPKLTIVQESATATLGQQLNKIGRTTGWTFGNVIGTCEDINVFRNGVDTGITLLCQNRVQAGAAGGDSGGPVFHWFGNSYVTLHGVIWGTDGTNFAYSPMGQVEAELGPLQTTTLVPPIAHFHFAHPGGMFDEMVSFDAGSSYDPDGGSIQSYHWNFGNGTRTTTQDSTSQILPSGYNSVSLTVTDNEGATHTTYRTVYVEGEDGCTVFACP